MLFSNAGTPNAYVSNVNSATNDITISNYSVNNYWPQSNSIPTRIFIEGSLIVRAYFIKNQTDLPGNMEENKIYFLRRTINNVKVYLTFNDAVNQVDHITFSTTLSGILFSVFFPDICYRYLNSWSPAAESISEIPCCPVVPDVYKDCPDTATITYLGQNITIKRNGNVRYNPTNLGIMKWYQRGNISAHDIFNMPDPMGMAVDWFPLFSINIGYSPFDLNNPFMEIRFFTTTTYFNNPDAVLIYLGIVKYKGNNSINSTKTMDFEYVDSTSLNYNPSFLYYLPYLLQNGTVPASIPVVFSGATNPPSQLKVFMPDAFFPNQNNPINLGQIEDTLTFDSDTLTYWGTPRKLAGIDGRLQFTIPNFYPLASSGTKYILNSNLFNQIKSDPSNPSSYRFSYGGDFDVKHLNTYSSSDFNNYYFNNFQNNEFKFYDTLRIEHIVPETHDYYEDFVSMLRLFVSCDSYGGYPTGLQQGTPWFDSRIVQNYSPRPDISLDQIQRKTAKMLIAFSKWEAAKTYKINGVFQADNQNISHYKQHFYIVKSVHPNAYITSLGI